VGQGDLSNSQTTRNSGCAGHSSKSEKNDSMVKLDNYLVVTPGQKKKKGMGRGPKRKNWPRENETGGRKISPSNSGDRRFAKSRSMCGED